MIILRREWLGLAVAMLYCVFAEMAIFGWLLVPATIPAYASTGASVIAIGVWFWSQWLICKRLRESSGGAVERELRMLSERSEQAIQANNLSEAHDLLRMALMINDEDSEINKRWAGLMGLMGRSEAAKRAWRRVLQLERRPSERRAAQEALARLATVSCRDV